MDGMNKEYMVKEKLHFFHNKLYHIFLIKKKKKKTIPHFILCPLSYQNIRSILQIENFVTLKSLLYVLLLNLTKFSIKNPINPSLQNTKAKR